MHLGFFAGFTVKLTCGIHHTAVCFMRALRVQDMPDPDSYKHICFTACYTVYKHLLGRC